MCVAGHAPKRPAIRSAPPQRLPPRLHRRPVLHLCAERAAAHHTNGSNQCRARHMQRKADQIWSPCRKVRLFMRKAVPPRCLVSIRLRRQIDRGPTQSRNRHGEPAAGETKTAGQPCFAAESCCRAPRRRRQPNTRSQPRNQQNTAAAPQSQTVRKISFRSTVTEAEPSDSGAACSAGADGSAACSLDSACEDGCALRCARS